MIPLAIVAVLLLGLLLWACERLSAARQELAAEIDAHSRARVEAMLYRLASQHLRHELADAHAVLEFSLDTDGWHAAHGSLRRFDLFPGRTA